MKAKCIEEVGQAVGRRLTKAEIDGIDRRLASNLRELARTDPNFRAMSMPERLRAAGKMSIEQDQVLAAKRAQRQASNLLAQAREAQNLQGRAAELTGKRTAHKALFERMRQLDLYSTGVKNEIFGNLMDMLLAVEPRFLGFVHDTRSMRDFVMEVFGKDSGNAIAKKGAKVYVDEMEKIRVRANAAGADIGKLDYGYLPQPHNLRAIAKAGKDEWVSFVMDRLDRTRYASEDGAAMDDQAMAEFIASAYDTISTEGRNKLVPGQGGRGSRAARFDEAHRALHFKDADSYLTYMARFGRGSVFDAIQGHVHSLGKSIGLMEQFGANPSATFRLLKDLAEKMDNVAGAREFGATADMVWDTLNGVTAQPVSPTLADFGQAVRNWTTAAKLQAVLLSSITDVPLHMLTAKYNGMPLGRNLTNTLGAFGGDTREAAARMGLAVESITSEMQRWHGDNLAQGWSGKMAHATMRAGLVEAWTQALRRGFALTHSATLNDMRAKDWGDLKDFDRKRLSASGITEADWRVYQLAEATTFKGQKLLTAESIRSIPDAALKEAGFGNPVRAANQAVARLLGYIDDEAHVAVLAPDLMTRAAMQQGTRAGTLVGEISRSVMLFKSFPLAIINRHLRRLSTLETGGKLAYSAAFITGLTFFGALSLQLKDVKDGKDPRDMTSGKFWIAAAMQGGGLGIFGDVVYTGMGGNARYGQANWTNLLGPVFGTVADAADITLGNIGDLMKGKDTKIGGELVRFAKGNMPLANLWYLRAAVDHAVMHDLQESLSPGYLRRLRERTRKEWGQDFWWKPGGTPIDALNHGEDYAPERAPDLGAAVGG